MLPFKKTLFFILMLLLGFSAQANDKESLDKQIKLAQQYAVAVSEQNEEALRKILTFEHIARYSGTRLFDDEQEVKNFVTEFLNPENTASIYQKAFAFQEDLKASGKYLRHVELEGKQRPLVRLEYTNGSVDYHILIIENDVLIVDLYVLTQAQHMSETMYQAIKLMVKPQETFLDKLLDTVAINEEVVETLTAVTTLQVEGKFHEAYQKLESLPQEIKQELVIIQQSTRLAGLINEREYYKQLGNMAKYHGQDPRVGLMLVDYYFYEQQYDQAIVNLENVQNFIGVDGTTQVFIANLHLMKEDIDSAFQALDKAIAAEPDYLNAYWTSIGLMNQLGQYQPMVNRLKVMQTQFGMTFDKSQFVSAGIYDAFVASDEFKAWLKD